jgi:hypothetical protein
VSASDHGQRRIGNRVQIPSGSAAVMDDEGLKKPLPSARVVRRDQRITPKSEDLLARAHKDLRLKESLNLLGAISQPEAAATLKE